MVGQHAMVDRDTAAFVGRNARHMMMRCKGMDGDEGLRWSAHVVAEAAEKSRLRRLPPLAASTARAPPLAAVVLFMRQWRPRRSHPTNKETRAGGGQGGATSEAKCP
uniref:Uncharacterized protein n=1 Tax=Oryza sativa subsp. japonica TaxID=39947 RepID=Q5Z7D6_ORYSJ|nr:hypothetical protein [Oryza sativa Japonica Group]